MAEKGDKTRHAIVKTAAGLFSQKGYTAVTMKDICEACGLSRGGLYRHFGSTKEIFLEVLKQDTSDGSEVIDQAVSLGLSAKKLMDGFFQLQRNDIAHNKNRIEAAVYEFADACPEEKEFLNERFLGAVRTFAKLIEYGQQKGEMEEGDAMLLAKHIVIFLEGLKLSSKISDLPEEFLEEQFDLLRRQVIR